MFVTRPLLFLAFSIVIAAAADQPKCAKELNVEKEDWVEFKKDPENPVDKMLCFFKCEYTTSGVFNEDKTVNVEKLIAHVENWRKLQESTKTEIRECVKKFTTPVNSCAEMQPFHLCVHKAVKKELDAAKV